MLNYTKMDDVLQKLDVSADSIMDLAQTQKKLDAAIVEIENAFNELQRAGTVINDSVQAIEKMEMQHQSLNDKIENVMQDYKKLHSSFEYIELELKKNSAVINEMQRDFAERIQIVYESNKLSMQNIEQQLTETKKVNKKLRVGLYVTVGISFVTVLLSIINLFI